MSGFQVATTEKNPRNFAMAIQQLYQGRSSATGTVTLAAGATSTVVAAPNCGTQSFVWLSPMTADAAAAVASTFISSVGQGMFTISHASAASTDRTFAYVALG
jgi:hypothetical protein